jgi:hypothetical protein
VPSDRHLANAVENHPLIEVVATLDAAVSAGEREAAARESDTLRIRLR